VGGAAGGPVRRLAALLLALSAGGCDRSTATRAEEPAADDLAPVADVPPFSLTSQRRTPFGLADLRGKVSVVNFVFTSCRDVCPLLSAHMQDVASHYAGADDVQFVSISVDPQTDTPDVLAAYAARFGGDPRWQFLTGDAAAVRAVVVDGFKMALERVAPASGGGVAEGAERPSAPGPQSILHGERFVIVDREGRIRAFPDPKEPGRASLYAAVDALRAR
jgi:protein SCO1/2